MRRICCNVTWWARDLYSALRAVVFCATDQVRFRWRQRERTPPSYVSTTYLKKRAERHAERARERD